MSAARPALVLAAALAAAGCGAGGDSDDSSTIDSGSVVDSGGADSAVCAAIVQFEPLAPIAPATVVARADVVGGSGVLTYTWVVTQGGVDVPFTPLDSDSRDIQFDAATPGFYDVRLDVGSFGCQGYFGGLNVAAPGANTRAMRLRFVPPSSLNAPPQERTLVVAGGADFAVGTITLDPGTLSPFTVRTPEAAPVAAYLRFTSRATPDAVVEGFSNTSGNASIRLVSGLYDVLIVPTSAALAPRVVTAWDPLSGALTIDGGLTLSGSVLDAGGAAVEGARVSVSSGGVPSTIGTTDATGAFSLRWREGATAESITVVPADGSDLPRLDAEVELGALSSIIVRHAAVPTSDVGDILVRVGGSTAPSTDVLISLTLPSSGTVRDGATVLAQATGSHRRTLRTDAAGRLPSARFVDGTGAAFITTTGPGAIAALSLPLAGPVDGAAAVAVTGHVRRSGGTDRSGARVRAVLTGPLAHTDAPAAVATAGSDGRFALLLAAGAPYTLTITDPTYDDAGLTRSLSAAAVEDLGDLDLPAALSLSGEIRAMGQTVGARAVGIAALCHIDCAGVERSRPLGEAVSDGGGRFVIAVPDPGVGSL